MLINTDYVDDNRQKVIMLAQLGCSATDIAVNLDIPVKEVKDLFKREIDVGRLDLRISLRKAQLEVAIHEKNPQMLLWLGKNLLGQRDPDKNLEKTTDFTIIKQIYCEKQSGEISDIELKNELRQVEIKIDD